MSDATSAQAGASWYLLDREDRISEVGGDWGSYAADGGASEVVGALIHDHIVGHFTRKLIREFFDRARATGRATRRTYRCDAPHVKRLMEVQAELLSDGRLRVTNHIVASLESPDLPPIRIADARAPANCLRCSMCNRLRLKRSEVWIEPDAQGTDRSELSVIHTVCPECRSGVSARRLWRFASSAAT